MGWSPLRNLLPALGVLQMFNLSFVMFQIRRRNCEIEGNSYPFATCGNPPKNDSNSWCEMWLLLIWAFLISRKNRRGRPFLWGKKCGLARFSRSCKHSCYCWRTIWEVQKHQQAPEICRLGCRTCWNQPWFAEKKGDHPQVVKGFLPQLYWAWFISLLSTMITMHRHM